LPTVSQDTNLTVVEFAHTTFNRLANSDPLVAPNIDWENLRLVHRDHGEIYRGLRDDTAKNDYKAMIIRKWKPECEAKGIYASQFTDWKLELTNPRYCIVSARRGSQTTQIRVVKTDNGMLVSSIGAE